MKYKKSALLIVSLALTAGCASADRYVDDYYESSADSFTTEAKVLESSPIYEKVTINKPETRCWNEKVRHRSPGYRSESYTPTIAGAILGGVVGNQFGKGSGKDAMTVAGTILGGSIGNDMRNRSYSGQSYVTTERRCETVDNYHETNELVGYNVKYRYNGRNFWARTDSDPGSYIRVNVSVNPVD